jgi:hypothetical protein
VDRVHGAVDRGQRRSTVDRGQRAQRRLTGVRRAGAGARRCSPAMEGEDEPVEAVLGRCSPATEGLRTGGNERRRLELVARAKEGAKELGREGMRCGEGRGSHRPFIGAGGAPERGGRGSNGGVNGVNFIEGGGEVKRGD